MKQIRLFILTILLLFLVAQPVAAQQMQKFHVESFGENAFDMSAREKPTSRDDGTGTLYAIIKVRSTVPEDDLGAYKFDFDYLKDVEEKRNGALWVYVQNGAKTMTIEREGFYPVQRYNLGTTLQPGKVYDLVLKPEPKVISMQFLVFQVTPADSKAMIMYADESGNEKLLGQLDENGTIAEKLVLGRYSYRIISKNYHDSEGIVTLSTPNGKHIETVTLRPNFARITLTVENGAEIYINDEKRGTGQWSGNLVPGTYSIECRKAKHKSTLETITVEDGKNITHTLKAPTPIVGVLSITSNPLFAQITVDGVSQGETPNIIEGLLIGTHTVTVSKEGYASATRTVEVRENETQEIEIELEKFSYELGKEPNPAEAVETYRKGAEQGDAASQYKLGWCYYNAHGVSKSYNEAVKWWRKAAEQGYADAQCSLGYCYEMGYGVSKNLNETVKWYRKSAEQGNVYAQYNLGYCYRNGLGVSKDYNEAVKWYRKAAEQGLAHAQCNLGVCYENGYGVSKNYNEAVKWYRKAAEQGNAMAQNNLGNCYYNGYGVSKNYNEAVKWYLKAAEQGYAGAQFNLGYCYYYGYGVSKDYNEAVKWYRKAAEQGNATAQYSLGVCYENGYGVSKDYNEAVKWYRKAAEQGDATAQCNLGYCYRNGYGVSKDDNEAVKWYRKAAEQGYASAQHNLGYCYRNGYGVSKDDNEAVKWYRKAAEQGNAGAQNSLGYCYENGYGVSKDLNEAVKWYRKAAEQGNATAKKNLEILGY